MLEALRLPQVNLCGEVFGILCLYVTHSFDFAYPLFRCESWTWVNLPFHYLFFLVMFLIKQFIIVSTQFRCWIEKTSERIIDFLLASKQSE